MRQVSFHVELNRLFGLRRLIDVLLIHGWFRWPSDEPVHSPTKRRKDAADRRSDEQLLRGPVAQNHKRNHHDSAGDNRTGNGLCEQLQNKVFDRIPRIE